MIILKTLQTRLSAHHTVYSVCLKIISFHINISVGIPCAQRNVRRDSSSPKLPIAGSDTNSKTTCTEYRFSRFSAYALALCYPTRRLYPETRQILFLGTGCHFGRPQHCLWSPTTPFPYPAQSHRGKSIRTLEIIIWSHVRERLVCGLQMAIGQCEKRYRKINDLKRSSPWPEGSVHIHTHNIHIYI